LTTRDVTSSPVRDDLRAHFAGNKPGIDPSLVFESSERRSRSKIDVHPQGANEPTASIGWSLMLSSESAPRTNSSFEFLPHADLHKARADAQQTGHRTHEFASRLGAAPENKKKKKMMIAGGATPVWWQSAA